MALKKKKRAAKKSELSITSMMDMMTIILVFLLKSYGADQVTVQASADLEIPSSSAKKTPEIAVAVIVSKSQIFVDGVPVVSLTMVPDEDNPGKELLAVPESEKKGQMISPLFDVLEEAAANAKSIAEASGNPDHEFKGRVLMQCDKTLPFSVIREVMYTAGQAQFGEFKFVVYKGGE